MLLTCEFTVLGLQGYDNPGNFYPYAVYKKYSARAGPADLAF
jgi:hypothetical protein